MFDFRTRYGKCAQKVNMRSLELHEPSSSEVVMLGPRLIHSQNATAVGSATADRKLVARRSQIAWILVVRPPRETPIAWFFAPLSTVRRAVRLHVGAVQIADLLDRALLRQRRQQTPEHATPAPAVPPVVDGRRRAIRRRHVLPAPAALQHVNDARDHSAIVDPPRSGLILW